MKIAFLSFYSGLVDRGIEAWTYELANRLSKKGHEITVYQRGTPKRDADYRVVVIRSESPMHFAAKVAWLLLKSEKQDIVVPSDSGWQLPFIRIAALLRGSKIVCVRHVSNWRYDFWHLLWRPQVLVSPGPLKSQLKSRLPSYVFPLREIPHGVDIDKFNPKGEVFKHELSRPVVICVAQANDWKRIPLAVEAIANTRASFLYVGGGGEDLKKIDKLGNSLLKKRYKRVSVPYEEMPKLYRSADLFTLPSDKSEAFGIVYLEAMASGLPVVATDDELRREIIGDAGILVNPKSIGAYTKALEKALSSNWDDKPRRQAEEFSWDKIAKNYEKLFQELT